MKILLKKKKKTYLLFKDQIKLLTKLKTLENIKILKICTKKKLKTKAFNCQKINSIIQAKQKYWILRFKITIILYQKNKVSFRGNSRIDFWEAKLRFIRTLNTQFLFQTKAKNSNFQKLRFYAWADKTGLEKLRFHSLCILSSTILFYFALSQILFRSPSSTTQAEAKRTTISSKNLVTVFQLSSLLKPLSKLYQWVLLLIASPTCETLGMQSTSLLCSQVSWS